MESTSKVKEDIFLDTRGLAQRWNKSPRTLENWRGKNEGPPYYKIGGKVLYKITEMETYEDQSIVSNGTRNS